MEFSSDQKIIHFPNIHCTYEEAVEIISELNIFLSFDNSKLKKDYPLLYELIIGLSKHLRGLS